MTSRPPAAPPNPWSVGAGLLALMLLAEFCASSWLWPFLSDAGWFAPKVEYRAIWRNSGFRGMPIEDIATALNRRLPLETPIRIGPSLAANDQWAQRLKEGLYPRRVRADAAVTLELG